MTANKTGCIIMNPKAHISPWNIITELHLQKKFKTQASAGKLRATVF
jgi:hypothetical protein